MVSYEKLKEKIAVISKVENPTEFVMEFLSAYDIPKATLVRMKITNGISTDAGIAIGNKLLIIYTLSENLYTFYNFAQKSIIKNRSYRQIMLFNARDILAFDTQKNEWLSVQKTYLSRECDFFFPLIGMERNTLSERQNANVKIGEKFAQLYNELLILNPTCEQQLNNLVVDLVCCLFADSFELILGKSMYSWINLYSKDDGTNLPLLLNNICNRLKGITDGIPSYIDEKVSIKSPIYVIHGNHRSLKFNKSTRSLLLKICESDWREVEPEVLGSLIQTIAFPTETSVAYNYTSTANVYKVIGPLFMDDLYSDFETEKKSGKLSCAFLDRLSKIKIFDPDCGTGNFLMVALRELRILESRVKEALVARGREFDNKNYVATNQFYGIEPKRIAVEITGLGLAFTALKYTSTDNIGELEIVDENIYCGFPLDFNWEEVCPKTDYQVFIIGNPIYMGARPLRQDKHLLAAIFRVFAEEINAGMRIGDLDLATGWLYLATRYIAGTDGGFAFVTTNSLTQGTHVPVLWPVLFKRGIVISFAYTRFKWKNEGRNNTAVTVVIIGCRSSTNPHKKTIYDDNKVYDAEDISPYLHKGKTIVVEESNPICAWMPKMRKGNMAAECTPRGQHTLFLTPEERAEIIQIYPEADGYMKRAVGSDEFVKHKERWCLWIDDSDFASAMRIPLIEERVEATRNYRLSSPSSQRLAEKPHQFRERYMPQKYTLVIPAVTGENRGYFQIGYVGKNVVVTNLAFAIYDAEPWVFGLLSSKMHHIWVCTVCGGLETRPRYSNVLGYNTFPIPPLSDEQKKYITEAALNVIMERENYSEKNLVELYNYDTMPESLKYAHRILDETVEQCYGKFYSDQERLDAMFQLYEKLKGV